MDGLEDRQLIEAAGLLASVESVVLGSVESVVLGSVVLGSVESAGTTSGGEKDEECGGLGGNNQINYLIYYPIIIIIYC